VAAPLEPATMTDSDRSVILDTLFVPTIRHGAAANPPDPTDVALDLLAAGDWRALARLSIDQLGGR
jgi:hypothetical protein